MRARIPVRPLDRGWWRTMEPSPRGPGENSLSRAKVIAAVVVLPEEGQPMNETSIEVFLPGEVLPISIAERVLLPGTHNQKLRSVNFHLLM